MSSPSPSALQPARPVDRFTNELVRRLLVAGFLLSWASSLASWLVGSEALMVAKVLRWPVLGLGAFVSLMHLGIRRIPAQSYLWLLSGLYALGTVVYSFDYVATLTRAGAFIATLLAMQWGGYVLARESTTESITRTLAFFTHLLMLSMAASVLAGVIGLVGARQGPLLRGVFGHANTLGALGALGFPVAVAWREMAPSRIKRSVLTGGLLAWLAAMYLSGCRAGAFSALGGAALYVLLTQPTRKLVLPGIAAAFLSLGWFVFSPESTLRAESKGTEFVFKGKSGDLLASRRGPLETTMDNFEQSPWVGHGFGTSVGFSEGPSEWAVVGLSGREKGNAYAAALEEVGVVGAVVLFAPLLALLAAVRKMSRTRGLLDPIRWRWAVAAWSAAVAGLVNNAAEATLWSPGATFSAVLLGLSGLASGLVETDEK